MRARDDLQEGAAPCSWGGGVRRKECGGRGKEEQWKERKGTRLCPFSGSEFLHPARSPRVYTLRKLERLRHEYVFPSAYFSARMVISGGGGADSCRV